MITVHHLNNSRSQRVLWLLEELGTKYEVKYYERDKDMRAPKELKAVFPLGKSPVITDGGTTVAESAVIIDYLIDKYGGGRFKPALGTPDHLRYNYFLHYAEGSVMPPLLVSLIFNKIQGPPVSFFMRPITKAIALAVKKQFYGPELKSHFDFLESEMQGREWLVGKDLTGADFQMSFIMEAGKTRGQLDSRPNLKRYLERIHARPAYKKAIEVGGPFSLSM